MRLRDPRLSVIAESNVQRLANGVLTTPAVFEPAGRAATVQLMWLTMADIYSAEASLLAAYSENLLAIRAAAGR